MTIIVVQDGISMEREIDTPSPNGRVGGFCTDLWPQMERIAGGVLWREDLKLISLWLKMLLCAANTQHSGWEILSRTERSLASILL